MREKNVHHSLKISNEINAKENDSIRMKFKDRFYFNGIEKRRASQPNDNTYKESSYQGLFSL